VILTPRTVLVDFIAETGVNQILKYPYNLKFQRSDTGVLKYSFLCLFLSLGKDCGICAVSPVIKNEAG
jgi:hypothetical protein